MIKSIINLIIIFKSVLTFNLDLNYPTIYKSTNSQNDYFGYSIVLFSDKNTNQSWMDVGAPFYKNPETNINSGGVFRCESTENCKLLNLIEKTDFFKSHFNGAWLGGSMDISFDSKFIVTCGHRYMDTVAIDSLEIQIQMPGLCYLYRTDLDQMRKLVPLREKDFFLNKYRSNVFIYYAHGEAGFAAYFPKDKHQLLISAPNFHGSRGVVMLYKNLLEKKLPKPNIPFTLYNHKKFKQDSYFGYAIAAGYFFERNKLVYFASTPTSNSFSGVILYDYKPSFNASIDIKNIIYSKQIGEYFGASLAVDDLNNDGYDDLIIGAPFHKLGHYNEGKVYVYLGKTMEEFFLDGELRGGQFGAHLQFIGDVNFDGFKDFAVAAPYADTTGIVYIYSGSSEGINTKVYKKIWGKTINPNLRGFGLKISKPADMDLNGSKDLAIGAYKSGMVVLLKSHHIVRISSNLISLVPFLNSTQKNFDIQTCFHSTSPHNFGNLRINQYIWVDTEFKRAKINGTSKFSNQLQLIINKTICNNITITIENVIETFKDPVTIALSFKTLDDQNSTKFCPDCPVYDPNHNRPDKIDVPFSLNCSTDMDCDAIPQINVNFSITNNHYIRGYSDYLRMDIKMTNVGERVHFIKLDIILPELISFRQTPSNCIEIRQFRMSCRIMSRFEKNATNLNLELIMEKINNGIYENDYFTIKTELITSGFKNDNNTNIYEIFLDTDAFVEIGKQSAQSSYLYNEKPFNLTQTYQLKKDGITPLDMITIELYIPSQYNGLDFINSFKFSEYSNEFELNDGGFVNFTDIEYEIYSNNSWGMDNLKNILYINCTNFLIKCKRLLLTIKLIDSKSILMNVNVQFTLDTNLLIKTDKSHDAVWFGIYGRVQENKLLNGRMKSDNLVVFSDLLVRENWERYISFWLWILAIIFGLIVLFIVVFILFKMGFFRRRKKEELQQIKNSEEFCDMQAEEVDVEEFPSIDT